MSDASVADPPVRARRPRVVIALCYHGNNNFLVIPDCPYCHCQHRHRVPGIKELPEKHCNGEVTFYHDEMCTKVSDCLTSAHTYALELRPKEEVPQEVVRMCRGITAKGQQCKRRARLGMSVCTQHTPQLQLLTDQQVKKLLET